MTNIVLSLLGTRKWQWWYVKLVFSSQWRLLFKNKFVPLVFPVAHIPFPPPPNYISVRSITLCFFLFLSTLRTLLVLTDGNLKWSLLYFGISRVRRGFYFQSLPTYIKQRLQSLFAEVYIFWCYRFYFREIKSNIGNVYMKWFTRKILWLGH